MSLCIEYFKLWSTWSIYIKYLSYRTINERSRTVWKFFYSNGDSRTLNKCTMNLWIFNILLWSAGIIHFKHLSSGSIIMNCSMSVWTNCCRCLSSGRFNFKPWSLLIFKLCLWGIWVLYFGVLSLWSISWKSWYNMKNDKCFIWMSFRL